MANLIFFGAPGAGKGTQAKMLAQELDLIHISTGDLLRIEVQNQTELGLIAKSYMEKGELVPDDVIISMVENIVKNATKGFILDGFPRTIPQAKALDEMLKKYNLKIDKVIFLDVPKDELVQRLLKRAQLEGRTDDQDPNVIENRINVYNEKTFPVLEFYQSLNKLVKINGVGEINEIYQAIKNAIN